MYFWTSSSLIYKYNIILKTLKLGIPDKCCNYYRVCFLKSETSIILVYCEDKAAIE